MDDVTFWDKAAPKYAKDPISNPAAYQQTLDRMKDILQPHHQVLEIGCGTGSTALELAPGVTGYLGTDISDSMIQIAKAKLGTEAPEHLHFAVHRADDLPTGPHDVILALNLLHLVPDLDATLRRVFDALPPGGLFISKTSLLRDGLWVLPLIIPVMRAFGKAPFVRSMRKQDLLGAVEKTGFETIETILQPGSVPRIFIVARKP